jgi:hypothetical protein
MQTFDLGTAEITPIKNVPAGTFTTITFTYTAGHPIDDSGFIKIAFRHVGDFGLPQFNDPSAPNYCTISTNGDCRIQPRWDPLGHIRPWSRALFLKIHAGFLNRGEQVIVVFGDRSKGSPGWQMQTFCVEQFEFKTLVDPIATRQFKELPTSPKLKVIPGNAHHAVCIAPSQIEINQPFSYHLKMEDRWGNPISKPKIFSDAGFDLPGTHYVTGIDPVSSLQAASNPINVCEEKDGLHPYWADFHGQSGETVGSGSIEDYFKFGREVALLDILGHQGNDFQITDAFWEKVNKISSEYNQSGKFVTFPGYEYSANTPLGGDRNVYFTKEGGHISRSSCELLPNNFSAFPDSPTAKDLFKNLAEQKDPPAFVFAHVGGRYADLKTHDADLELAVEIHSAWGTFEWLLKDALDLGYKIGICANSDGHKCRPGASYPGASTFGSYGGLTCVLSESLDREHIYSALKKRHFYATTGVRILADVRLEWGNGETAVMGDAVEIDHHIPTLSGSFSGTAPIENIRICFSTDSNISMVTYKPEDLGNRIKIVWSGAEVRGRDRKTIWDGNLHIDGNKIVNTTPINFWNADHPLQLVDDHNLAWNSITTGGLAGFILDLEKQNDGIIELNTRQKSIKIRVDEIGFKPFVWSMGGLEKEIRIYRLPDMQERKSFTFSLPLENLSDGLTPVYLRMEQEDGHLAWTSPIYINKSN